MRHPPCTCHACGQRPDPCAPSAPSCSCAPPPCPPKPDCACAPRPACRPQRPPRPEGVLLPKILCCERRSIPCLCTDLALNGLSCAEPPFSLLMVRQSGARPSWTPLDEPDCTGRVTICISIPICAQVSDRCGRRHSADGRLEVETCLRLPASCADDCDLFIVPHVRLICAEDCPCDPVFRVRLQIQLDIYAVRPEPCMLRRPEPACPDLPLYPPPIRPDLSCWPQCPADPAPCGWPRRG